MAADSLRNWFIKHDIRFGMSLMSMTPEQQGEAICERYKFDAEELRRIYEESGDKTGDEALLRLLNAWSDEYLEDA